LSGAGSGPRCTDRGTEVESCGGRDDTFSSVLTPREECGQISGRSDPAVWAPDHEDIPRLGRVVGEPVSQLWPVKWGVLGRRDVEVFGSAYVLPTSGANKVRAVFYLPLWAGGGVRQHRQPHDC